MKKTQNRLKRILCGVLTVMLLLHCSALSLTVVTEGISDLIAAATDEPSVMADKPTSVPQSVTVSQTNPNDVNVYVQSYPIYTSKKYESLLSSGLMTGYKTRRNVADGYSPYYTASIGTWYSYEVNRDVWGVATYDSKLPYREERANMLHPDLTVSNAEINIRLITDDYDYYATNNYRELASGYLTDVLKL